MSYLLAKTTTAVGEFGPPSPKTIGCESAHQIFSPNPPWPQAKNASFSSTRKPWKTSSAKQCPNSEKLQLEDNKWNNRRLQLAVGPVCPNPEKGYKCRQADHHPTPTVTLWEHLNGSFWKAFHQAFCRKCSLFDVSDPAINGYLLAFIVVHSCDNIFSNNLPAECKDWTWKVRMISVVSVNSKRNSCGDGGERGWYRLQTSYKLPGFFNCLLLDSWTWIQWCSQFDLARSWILFAMASANSMWPRQKSCVFYAGKSRFADPPQTQGPKYWPRIRAKSPKSGTRCRTLAHGVWTAT